MSKLASICVFCGSSPGSDPDFKVVAKELGALLADQEITLVYGGAKIGIMGQVAEAALDNDGVVIGVIPEFLKTKEVVHTGLSELIVNKNMHERKMKMQELSDGFIALPGGFGTLEELFEILTWGQLGLHQKPIGLLNVNGYYDDLLRLFQTMVGKGLLKENHLRLLLVDTSAQGLLNKMRNYRAKELPKGIKLDKNVF